MEVTVSLGGSVSRLLLKTGLWCLEAWGLKSTPTFGTPKMAHE